MIGPVLFCVVLAIVVGLGIRLGRDLYRHVLNKGALAEFGRLREEQESKRQERIARDSEPVPCSECGALLDRGRAQCVAGEPWPAYFCALHRKPYDQARLGMYWRQIQCDKDGVPLGYRKAPTSKKPARRRR